MQMLAANTRAGLNYYFIAKKKVDAGHVSPYTMKVPQEKLSWSLENLRPEEYWDLTPWEGGGGTPEK